MIPRPSLGPSEALLRSGEGHYTHEVPTVGKALGKGKQDETSLPQQSLEIRSGESDPGAMKHTGAWSLGPQRWCRLYPIPTPALPWPTPREVLMTIRRS